MNKYKHFTADKAREVSTVALERIKTEGKILLDIEKNICSDAKMARRYSVYYFKSPIPEEVLGAVCNKLIEYGYRLSLTEGKIPSLRVDW